MQRFNWEARKYRGVIPPITATSLRDVASKKPENAFVGFGRMAENSPEKQVQRDCTNGNDIVTIGI
jgi:hypothetical protein